MTLIKNITVDDVSKLFKAETSRQYANPNLAKEMPSLQLEETSKQVLKIQRLMINLINQRILGGNALEGPLLRYCNALHELGQLAETKGKAWRDIIFNYDIKNLSLKNDSNQIESQVRKNQIAPYRFNKPQNVDNKKRIVQNKREQLINETIEKLKEISNSFQQIESLFSELEKTSIEYLILLRTP